MQEGIYKKRLLCVEDHKETCELISSTLRDFEVTSAGSCARALDVLQGQRFDLIIVDYYLPDGNGEYLCKAIREFDQRTPVLFITASEDFTETRSRRIGGQGMIKKGRATFVAELRERSLELT